jgi:hypothetical protein
VTAITNIDISLSLNVDVPSQVELVLVFASNTEVLNAEDRLEAGNFKFALIPVPKEVNPNCGLALSISGENASAINQALAQAGLNPLSIYQRRGENWNIVFLK